MTKSIPLYRSLMLTTGIVLFLTACTAPAPSPEPEPASPIATATLIACDDVTPVPDRGSILPTFTPSYPCELENVSKHVDFCMVRGRSDFSYPCSQTESIQEITLGEGSQTVLIQRDYHFSSGCWHGVNSNVRSLRVCDSQSGESTTLAEDVACDAIASPDRAGFAFVAAEPGSFGLKPHLFRVRLDGTGLLQLDTRPFPQEQVVATRILRWSEDGAWLDVSLWDGHEGGFHRYCLRTDGSGQFERLP
jgi:hypothetical protein